MFRLNGKFTKAGDKYNPTTRGWYKQVKMSNKAIATEPYISVSTKLPTIAFAAPINKNGKFEGFIGIDIQLSQIVDDMLRIAKSEDSYAFIMDKNGKILIHHMQDLANKQTAGTKSIVEEMNKSENKDKYLLKYVNSRGEQRTPKLCRHKT